MNVSKTKERIALVLVLVVVSIVGRWLILPGLDLPDHLSHMAENAFQGLFGAALVMYLMSSLRRENWQKADPKTRREMEVAQRDERNQLMEEKAAAFGFEMSCYVLAAAYFVLSALDCTAGEYAVLTVFAVQFIAYLWKGVRLKNEM